MRVVVTGAAGTLGSVTTALLRAEGHDVVATDRVTPPEPPPGFVTLDLLSGDGLAELFAGAAAIVHLAALPDRAPVPATMIFAQNLQTTACVLSAGISCGVEKFVYASSVQVTASEAGTEKEPVRVAYLPLDGDSPANPTNAYGMSKLGGEVLSRTLLQGDGREVVALRFPWLVAARPDRPWGRRLLPLDHRERRVVVEQGLGCLSLNDAARLIHAVLQAHLPGFRVYLPSVSVVPPEYIARYVERYYRGVPLRVSLESLRSFVDLSRISEETGWVPVDVPIHAPPPLSRSASFARLVRRLMGAR